MLNISESSSVRTAIEGASDGTGLAAEGRTRAQMVIIAGGLSTRLGPLTKDKPKSMITILGKPFLEYQLELLRKDGIDEVVLCVGHLGRLIEDYFGDGQSRGMRIRYSYEDMPVGTAGALRNAETLLGDTFFTLYGDSYLLLDLTQVMRYFTTQNKLALMTVYRNYDWHEQSNTAIKDNLVTKYSKKHRTEDMVYIDYGASILRKEALKLIPKNRPYSLEELFPRLIEQGELLSYEVKDRYYEIGSPAGLMEFTNFVRERK